MEGADGPALLIMSSDVAEAKNARARRTLSAAEQALQEATEHKRRAAWHKRRTRESMARFENFKKDLEAMGITVIVEEAGPERHITTDHQDHQGGPSDDSSDGD